MFQQLALWCSMKFPSLCQWFEICEVSGLAVIHKGAEPIWLTGQRGTKNNLGFLLYSGYIFEPIVYYINSLVCACVCDHWTHRLRDGKKKSDGGCREKWREENETTVGCVACVCLSPETQVLRLRSWNPGPEIEVRRVAQGFFPALFRRTAQG